VEVYLALGSNLGDRIRNLTQARLLLQAQVHIERESSIYQTPPWGYLEQPSFLNQVIKGKTMLAPHALLDFLKGIERSLGRKATFRYGPRVIDLDILLYSNRIINSKRLQVPHPRLFERAFVLVPLNELAPGLVLPGNTEPVNSLLSRLDTKGIQKYDLMGTI
jgi:2-amino-4-hydroxy-6-hydroxymethyldihydropteridine diphosphokinase